MKLTERQLYTPDQVISEMIRKVADGEEVDGQSYLDLFGDHSGELSARLRELSEDWSDDNEISETVGGVLAELAGGNISKLGEFGDNSDAAPTTADSVAMQLKELAAKLWTGGENSNAPSVMGEQPA